MKLLQWLKRRPRVVDLPEQFGERLRLEALRALFADRKEAPMLRAFAQLLWMHRRRADEDARAAALKGKDAAFHLGEMETVDAVLADLQALTAGAEPDAQVKAWFKS